MGDKQEKPMAEQISLRDVVMFSKLSDEALADVRSKLKERHLAAGEIIFNQGDIGDELIIVKEGVVSIFMPVESQTQDVQAIRIFMPGQMLGEMALIDQKPRSASARAEEPSRILTLSKYDFQNLLEHSPELALSVMSGLSDRIRYTTDFLGEVSGWIQRIAEGNYQTSAAEKSVQYKDQNLASLAAQFAQMSARVQEREETLRKEVARLRIEIDEAKRKKDAERIMSSDYYKKLKEQARKLRSQE